MGHFLSEEEFCIDGAVATAMSGGLANSNYRVQVPLRSEGGEKSFVVKVCDEKTREELLVQCAALACARAGGVRVAACIPRLAGGGYVLEHSLEGRTLRVMLYEFLSGATGENEAANEAQVRSVGEELARLHSIATSRQGCLQPCGTQLPPFPMGVAAIRPFLDAECPQALRAHPFVTDLAVGVEEFAAAETAHTSLPRGIVHGDLFMDNIVFQSNGEVDGLLDFEEVCHAALLLDVAMTICGCCYKKGESLPDPGLSQAFLRAYNDGRAMTEEETRLLPIFLHYCMLVIAFWRFRQFNVRHPGHELADYYDGPWQRAKALKTARRPLLS